MPEIKTFGEQYPMVKAPTIKTTQKRGSFFFIPKVLQEQNPQQQKYMPKREIPPLKSYTSVS